MQLRTDEIIIMRVKNKIEFFNKRGIKFKKLKLCVRCKIRGLITMHECLLTILLHNS